MNANEKKKQQELSYCAVMQDWVNKRLAWAANLPTGEITTQDGPLPPPPANPPPPPHNG